VSIGDFRFVDRNSDIVDLFGSEGMDKLEAKAKFDFWADNEYEGQFLRVRMEEGRKKVKEEKTINGGKKCGSANKKYAGLESRIEGWFEWVK